MSGGSRAWPGWTAPVCAAIAATLATAWSARMPDVRGADAPPEAFSAERAMPDVEALSRLGPHPVGGAAHARARDHVVARMKALGLEPTIERGHACYRGCADVENVVGRFDGDAPAIAVAAHYDSVAAGPGAADDGAGVATALEIARALRDDPARRRALIILITDGEEAGLLGARAFAASGKLEGIGVVLELEARGTSGQTAMFETSPGSSWLVSTFGRVAPRPVSTSLLPTLYHALPNDTDLTVFLRAGVQGLNFAFADEVWNYHTLRDDAAHLDPRSVQHMGDQALATTRVLVDAEAVSPPGAEAVWFDVLTIGLVRYDVVWARVLAGLALGAAFASLRKALGARETSRGSLALGALRPLAAACAAAGLGLLVARASVATLHAPHPWAARPWPFFAALVAVALIGSALVNAALDRITPRDRGPLAGATLFWALVSATVAFLLPAASHLFTWPALALAAALAAPLRYRVAASALPVLVGGALWVALLRTVLVMAGAEVHVAVTLPTAIAASLLVAAARSAGRKG